MKQTDWRNTPIIDATRLRPPSPTAPPSIGDFNPHHDPHSGEFASGGGSGSGGEHPVWGQPGKPQSQLSHEQRLTKAQKQWRKEHPDSPSEKGAQNEAARERDLAALAGYKREHGENATYRAARAELKPTKAELKRRY